MASNIGQAVPSFAGNDFNAISFIASQLLAGARICMLVQVLAVTTNGGVAGIGTVNVQPLVQQVNGLGEVTPHGTIFNLPYIRIQGGGNAVILDPQVGDIGIICIADRDSSAAIASKNQAPPGSRRKNSPADGFYMMSVISSAPTQYMQFNTGGINIITPNTFVAKGASGASNPPTVTMSSSSMVLSFGGNSITVDGSGIHFHGPVTGDNTATFTGEGTFNGGHTVSAHHHAVTGIQTGGSTVTSQTPTG